MEGSSDEEEDVKTRSNPTSDSSDRESNVKVVESSSDSEESCSERSSSEHHSSPPPLFSSNEKTAGAGQQTSSSWLNRAKDGTGSESKEVNKSRTDSIRDIIREAAVLPELYGIRRSGRPRRELTQLNEDYDSDDEDTMDNSCRRRTANTRSRYQDESDFNDGQSDSQDTDHSDYRKPVKRKTSVRAGGSKGRRTRRGRPSKMKLAQKSRRRSMSDDNDDDNRSSNDNYSSCSEDERKRRMANKRPAAQTMSYKEQSEDSTDTDDVISGDGDDDTTTDVNNDTDAIERVFLHRIGRKGATGAPTVTYVAEQEGDPNEDETVTDTEVQYWIKWKGWAHIHNTWESEESLRLAKVGGMKRLENYQKKEALLRERKRYANPEELEYLACQQEMNEDMISQYAKAERIVRCRKVKNDDGATMEEYLVKWQGLPYSQCTDEDALLINRLFPKAVDEFERRQRCATTPNKYCKALKQRPKFQPLRAQPNTLGAYDDMLKLRDYQLEGLNWLLHAWCKENSVILADEMGLGKTIQTISFIAVLMDLHQMYGPYLILVPLSTVTAWMREFQLWAPHINVVEYLGDVVSRTRIREEEWCYPTNKKLKFNVVLTTYEILLKDKSVLGGVSWSMLIVDEAHRLKNEDSLLYKSLITFESNHRLLITGTPLQNSLKELWALLHFLMPRKYDRWEDFEVKHTSADKTGFCHLHAELEPYLLRRVKKDVEKSLPAKVEQILRVEMSKIQKQYYKWILTKNYKELTKGVRGKVSSFVNIAMELKKCCNHASLVRPDDNLSLRHDNGARGRLEVLVKSSGKLILLDKLLMRLRESNHRVLIFSQMVRMLDILAEYLQLRRFPFQRLDGSIRGELRKQALDHFNAEGSQDFCFLLSTRAGGLGINLATADTVIIFDSDWNPQNDLQAQARAHRIGQKNQVSVYRLITKNSMEEDILERAKKKMILDHLVIQRMDTTGRTVLNKTGGPLSSQNPPPAAVPFNADELNEILRFGAEELFNKDEDEDDTELQVDIDDILRMAETRNTEDLRNSTTDELLSQFKVVSFDNLEDDELESRDKVTPEGTEDKGKFWDRIIPEVDRKRMEEEELHQQLLVLNPPPRSRKNVSKGKVQSDGDPCRQGAARKRHREEENDDDRDDDDESDMSKRDRKRSRGVVKADKTKEFTSAEIRLVVRSMKKFARPRERLEAIAVDTGLRSKPRAVLLKLIDDIHERCGQTMSACEQIVSAAGDQPVKHPPTFKFSKVVVNAKLVLQAMAELEPLALWMEECGGKALPEGMEVKESHFDCSWSERDDAALLRGVHEYGVGSWDSIRLDEVFDLAKMLPEDDELKPQAKHLQARVEYLLRCLRRHLEKSKHRKHSKKTGSKGGAKTKGKESEGVVASGDELGRGAEEGGSKGDITSTTGKRKKSKKKGGGGEAGGSGGVVEEGNEKRGIVSKPLHFTTSETHAVDNIVEAELPPEIFTQCKEKMRPVKKSLKRLGGGSPGSGGSHEPRNPEENTRRCLLKIGDHINRLLAEMSNLAEVRQWRGNLWHFVSKFTEFEAKRLHKVYKHMAKKREEQEQAALGPATPGDSSQHRAQKPANDVSSTAHHRHHHRHHSSTPPMSDPGPPVLSIKLPLGHNSEMSHKYTEGTSSSKHRQLADVRTSNMGDDCSSNDSASFTSSGHINKRLVKLDRSSGQPVGGVVEERGKVVDRWAHNSPLVSPPKNLKNKFENSYQQPPNASSNSTYHSTAERSYNTHNNQGGRFHSMVNGDGFGKDDGREYTQVKDNDKTKQNHHHHHDSPSDRGRSDKLSSNCRGSKSKVR